MINVFIWAGYNNKKTTKAQQDMKKEGANNPNIVIITGSNRQVQATARM